jgi:hypothetical protein
MASMSMHFSGARDLHADLDPSLRWGDGRVENSVRIP